MRLFHTTVSAASLLLALATNTSLASVGGGGIPDNDPSNDALGTPDFFAASFNSVSRVGLCNLLPGGDVDHLSLFLQPSNVLTVMTVPLAPPPTAFSGPDTLVSVMTTGGVVKITNDNAGTDQTGNSPNAVGSVVRYTSPSNGETVIRVSGKPGASGPYAVVVTNWDGNNADFVETEPNNTPATALRLAAPLSGPLLGFASLSAGDVDYFAFDLHAGDILALATTPVGATPNLNSPDTVVFVLMPDGTTVACSNDDAGDDFPVAASIRGSAVRYRATADGRYYVGIRGFLASTTGNYLITTAVIPGSSCPADLNSDGNVDTFDLVAFLGKFGHPCP
jgi:hypothetical protein